jgi:hypothetical protein
MMHRLVDLLPVPVVTTTLSGRVVDANAAASGVLGMPPAALFGKPLPAYVSQPDRQAMRTALTRMAERDSAHLVLGLTPRHGTELRASVVVMADELPAEPGTAQAPPEQRRVVRWIMAPASVGGEEQHAHDRATLEALAQLCQLPLAEGEQRALLQRLAELSSATVSDAQWTSVSMGEPERPTLLVGDSAQALSMQAAEMQAGEGPCFDAYRYGEPSVTGRLADDPRWPRLARLARETGVQSVLAVPIRVAGRTAGSLNLFSERPDVMLSESDQQRMMIFGAAAAALLEDAERMMELRATADQLQQAMTSRAPIEQAKGIIIASLHCTPDEAFTHLIKLSQRRNMKLRALAADIVRANARRQTGVS